jgi:hypothetical protein
MPYMIWSGPSPAADCMQRPDRKSMKARASSVKPMRRKA